MSGRYPDFIKIAENAQVDFVVADPHFGHDDILRHTERRNLFRDVAEMDDFNIELWNGIVGRRDYVWIIGDFAFKDHQRYLNALNGKKILVLGDHDKMATAIFERMTGVYPFHVRTVEGQSVVFHHWPMASWPDMYDGALHLHGHVHARRPENAKLVIDMSWDAWWQPVRWEIITAKAAMKKEGSWAIHYRDIKNDKSNAFDLARKNLLLLLQYDSIPKLNNRVLKHFGLSEKQGSETANGIS